MKNFGQIKTAIENKLVEGYKTKTFSAELKKFKELVLGDKETAKLFYIYDSLSKPHGYSQRISEMFVNESVKRISKIDGKMDLTDLLSWVGPLGENRYQDIDDSLNEDIRDIQTVVESKQRIMDLLSEEVNNMKPVKLPLNTMLSVADKTIKEVMKEMTEEEKNDFTEIVSINEEELADKYNALREETLAKLKDLIVKQTEPEMMNKIAQVMERVENDEVSKVNYYGMKKLVESI